ncbi:MAG: hemerythrin family protein [Candidatus Thiodiazotropha endolucinida]|nr:hemerythrin family protein [Candidatus Thiodiazotropha taylori]MCG8056210.1 hemerythrin family protein [Candidatus Thiodiazotropha taylori]MCG8108606.1 hemerythrin family protein [Candidatus Thiodiazotropha taylori]MCW4312083.1 hemerythrin family protein [Candidatus Thiodiazotropha taylori]
MSKSKSIFQKASLVSAGISFLLAIVSAVLLYFRIESVGKDDPISASFMASTFFFVCVGVVLTVIGKVDLPSFKLDNSESERK